MKIIGVLCWAEEKPLWLTAAVVSLAPLLDHLIALDGKYLLYPGSMQAASSNVEQSMAILEAASACNLGLTLYRPSQPFMENEVEKRNLSIALADTIKTSEEDWILVFDADMVARKFDPAYLRNDLEQSDAVVAEYARYENPEDEGFTPIRGLYRAIDGLGYGPAHWCVSIPTETGELAWLWGDKKLHTPYIEAMDFSALKFDHRNTSRDKARFDKAAEYYMKRDDLGVESFGNTFVQDLNGDWVNTKDREWNA